MKTMKAHKLKEMLKSFLDEATPEKMLNDLIIPLDVDFNDTVIIRVWARSNGSLQLKMNVNASEGVTEFVKIINLSDD